MSEFSKTEEKLATMIKCTTDNDVLRLRCHLYDSGILLINKTDENGMTLLHHACFKGNKTIVKMLLDLGANCHFYEQKNLYTSLHFACLAGNVEVCLLLLDAGIDHLIRNKVNQTASQLAAFIGNYNCVSTINSFIHVKLIEEISETPEFVDTIQRFLINPNLNPIRILLNFKRDLILLTNFEAFLQTLEQLQENCYRISDEFYLKFNYIQRLMGLVSEIRLERGIRNKIAIIDRVLKKLLDNPQTTFRSFLHTVLGQFSVANPKCAIANQIMLLDAHDFEQNPLAMLNLLILGREQPLRSAKDSDNNIHQCSCCTNSFATISCPKCKTVMYCDKMCLSLHRHHHKPQCVPKV